MSIMRNRMPTIDEISRAEALCKLLADVPLAERRAWTDSDLLHWLMRHKTNPTVVSLMRGLPPMHVVKTVCGHSIGRYATL